jgi:hypothetical protein
MEPILTELKEDALPKHGVGRQPTLLIRRRRPPEKGLAMRETVIPLWKNPVESEQRTSFAKLVNEHDPAQSAPDRVAVGINRHFSDGELIIIARVTQHCKFRSPEGSLLVVVFNAAGSIRRNLEGTRYQI